MNIQSKKGQVTIFIIIGVIVVAAAALIYFVFPDIISENFGSGGEENPSALMQTCLQETLKEKVDLIALNGGLAEPEFYMDYNNEKFRYLCYASKYYENCVVQEPMLINTFSDEVAEAIKDKEEECLRGLKETYEDLGYSVTIGSGDTRIDLLPRKIEVVFDKKLTLRGKEQPLNYDSFKVELRNNNLYELLSIANNIIEWETLYGDAETTSYMAYYRDIKVEKMKQIEGSTIYIISDRNTGDKFQFASRSVAWPPVYGLDSLIEEEQ